MCFSCRHFSSLSEYAARLEIGLADWFKGAPRVELGTCAALPLNYMAIQSEALEYSLSLFHISFLSLKIQPCLEVHMYVITCWQGGTQS